MKKRQKILIFIGGAILVSGFFVYMIFIFAMFPIHKELLLTIDVPKQNYKIAAYYVNGGATTGNLIRIVKKYDFLGYEKTLKNIERYVDVKEMKLISENELKVIVGFKSKFSKKVDTVFVKID
jgi:Family of unknown function (DUF5412)